MRFAIVLSCSVALLGSVGTASAQDWTKSKWGPDDEIGAANYMKPELVLKAAQQPAHQAGIEIEIIPDVSDIGPPLPDRIEHPRCAERPSQPEK